MSRTIFTIVLILLMFGGATAGIIKVPADYATIQAGINAAMTGDTVLVQPGTYTENISFIGKNIVLGSLFITTGLGTYIKNTIIDGSKIGSVVTIRSGEDSTTVLCGFTITNGYALCGGGIDCHEAYPRLSHLIVVDNIADDGYWLFTSGKGGGIHLRNSRATLDNLLLVKNQSSRWGGAVCVTDSKIKLNQVTIIGNKSEQGGGINFENDQGSSVINSIVWANQVQPVIVSGGAPSITYSDIEGGWIGEGNININPFFFDQEQGDYYLADCSPCIGKGTIKVQSFKDLAGNPRPDPPGSMPDLGAYENHLSNPKTGSNITVDVDTLNFGKLFIGDSSRIQLRVRNTGLQDLLIFSVEANPKVFNVFPGFAGIDPMESDFFTVTFKPVDAVRYEGSLILNSNDSDQSQLLINMIGQGLRPPKIWVEPDSLFITLAQGTISNQILTVSNQGYSDLVVAVYPGKSNHSYALQFDGIDDYVEVPNDPSLNLSIGTTIETWVNISTTDGAHTFVAKWNDNTNDYSYIFKDWDESDKLSIELSKNFHNDLCALQSRSPLPLDTWIHVATTFDGQAVKLYMNGQEENTSIVQGTIRNSQTDLIIGALYAGEGILQHLRGMMDEIRIWNYARSPEEINDFMYTELAGSEPGLAAYWRFNEGIGDSTFDNSLNENNGKLYGNMDWVQSEVPLGNYWMTCTPQKCICKPNSSQQIFVSIDATKISANHYDANIMITSNDPSQSIVYIPIKLDVITPLEQGFNSALPRSFELHQNYPNPFNPSTTIEFALPKSAFVTLKVYNLLGEEVATVVAEKRAAGWYKYTWNVRELASGVYLYRLEADDFVQSKKLILMR